MGNPMPAVRSWLPSRVSDFHYYEPKGIMPRIPDFHLQSVVFVFPSVETARDGTQVGGSGFVFYVSTGIESSMARYVITNEHVVSHGGHWVRLNHPNGTHIVHIPPDDWVFAPEGDDFAVAQLRLPRHVQPTPMRLDDWALTRENASALRVGPGDEAYMVGRFLGHGGRVTNNPVARFGSIALMPNVMEPIRDGRDRDVEAYLIEMRSQAGFSGSPVFVLIPPYSFRGVVGDTSLETNETRFRLLGIDTGHMFEALPVQEKTDDNEWVNVKRRRVRHYSDMAVVAPIWKVVDLMNREDMMEQRRQVGHELKAKHEHENAESDFAPEPTDETESVDRPFTKSDFEDALRKVSRKASPPDEGTSGT